MKRHFFGHLFQDAEQPMERWQQFVVHARDERGDPVSDYLIDVLRKNSAGEWVPFTEMYTGVHAYGADQSFRRFHIRLPQGISSQKTPLHTRSPSPAKVLLWLSGHLRHYNRGVIKSSHRGVDIWINLWQSEDNSWTGECTLHYHDKSVVPLAPVVGFQTRESAKDQALNDARAYIDNHRAPMPHHI